MESYGHRLRSGRKLGIWGLGYIGYSSMAHFARAGIQCLGFDLDPAKLRDIKQGSCAMPNMEYWLGFDVKPLTQAGLMTATDRWEDLIAPDVLVHLICVPTEQGARPYDEPIKAVMKCLGRYKTLQPATVPLVIIESTITPTLVDDVVIPILESEGLKVGRDVLVGVAPRRDWFISPEKSVRTLPRVVGGTTPDTTAHMKDVLGLVCETVLPAPDHRHSALVKSIENAYRQVEIALANQLSLAYPDIDMLEVLALVGTKWNIGTYQPSFGTGGYCIPLAPHYVMEGALRPDCLSILRASVESERELPRLLARKIAKKYSSRRVGIAGLSYKGDLKVSILSPTLGLINGFRDEGVEVKVNDPYYSAEEIKQIAGVESFAFPDGLSQFDTVLVVADHLAYRSVPFERLRQSLAACRVVVDNTEVWSRFPLGDIPYIRVGSKGLLSMDDESAIEGAVGSRAGLA